MTHRVSSYVAGQWHTPTGENGLRVTDPTNGEVVALVNAEDVDVEAAVTTARTEGGPALRALTFHGRALLLKKLAKHLAGQADELVGGYTRSGVTAADARIDVDGGTQVLAAYARIGLKEFPDDTVLAEDEAEPLIGNPNFVGQTIYTSRPGIALHINAFNFPMWGMLEKLATSFLAGTPSIVKPASQTAHLAEAVFRRIVESGILPEGTVQFIAGHPRGLLDGLGVGDHIAVTGSARTAATLRQHPAVAERGAALNAEADSVNATVLGPDAGRDTDEFTLFAKSVVREMTSRSGQKCTAIRRILVPSQHVDAVVEEIGARLAKVVVGDPRTEGVHMGPLVSATQRADVAAAVRELSGGAQIVIGGPDAPAAPEGACEEHGFFAPTLLVATDRRHPAVHGVEAFGPVATVIPFDSPQEAAELAALGEGSLVASVVSNDGGFVRDVVRAIAPWHGRVLVLNREIARGATPHGAVLPHLIHGGPGRAGGGEELGGKRGVLRLMQATSVASSANMNVALTDRWNPGADQLDPGVHPFRLHLEDLRLGDTLRTASRRITEEDVQHFAEFTGDTFYAHVNEEAAAASPIFEGRVAHGYFILAAAAGLFVDPEPGPVLANFGLENLRFTQPVYFGDEIKLRLTAKHKTKRAGTGWGEVTWNVEVTNQRDEVVATYDLLTINASKDA